MRSLIYFLNDKMEAEQLAEDLKVQLEINRFRNVMVVPVNEKKELIIQVPEANGELEEAVEAFMEDYKEGVMLE